MPLAKHSIKYGKWSNKALKQHAELRGVQLPHTDRRDWIRLLREKDQEASIRFLDLPPEIRNVIYRELLTPTSDRKDPESFVCSPAILASCKQVYDEAADIINTTTRIPVALHLRSEYVRAGFGLREEYAVEVGLNGKMVCYGDHGKSSIDIDWPRGLRRLRSITVQIVAEQFRNFSHPDAESAGHQQLNSACAMLYRTLWDSQHLRDVHVDFSYELHQTATALALLSPILALAWWFGNFTYAIYTRSQTVAQGIGDTVAAFKKIRALTAEANLQVELNSSLLWNQNALQSQGAVPKHAATAMQRIDVVTKARRSGPLTTFAALDQLRQAILFIEENLNCTKEAELEDRAKVYAEKLQELKKIRLARNVEDKG